MQTRLYHLAALCLMVPVLCPAQITSLGSYNGHVTFVRTLSTGPKLFTGTVDSIALLEPDLTVYATVTFPPPPPGYMYTSSPMYFTETLFDTDPQNFEFVARIRDNNNVNGIVILRQDGTILLTDLTHSIGGGSGIDEFSSTYPIVNTPTGTYMVLPSGSIFSNETARYLLPGTLPCLDCTGGDLMVSDPQASATSSLQAYPDPATDLITLQLSGVQRSTSALLQVLAADGRMVLQQPMPDAATQLDVQGWSNGTYHVRIVTSTSVLAQGSFVVQR